MTIPEEYREHTTNQDQDEPAALSEGWSGKVAHDLQEMIRNNMQAMVRSNRPERPPPYEILAAWLEELGNMTQEQKVHALQLAAQSGIEIPLSHFHFMEGAARQRQADMVAGWYPKEDGKMNWSWQEDKERKPFEIDPDFLLGMKEAIVEMIGMAGIKFVFSLVRFEQGAKLRELAVLTNRIALEPVEAIQFIEQHLRHLGVPLTGSVGQMRRETKIGQHAKANEFAVLTIALAESIKLQPEFISARADRPVPEPYMTLYCLNCDFQIRIKESAVPGRIVQGCVKCGNPLAYEFCLADGTPRDIRSESFRDRYQVQAVNPVPRLSDEHEYGEDD